MNYSRCDNRSYKSKVRRKNCKRYIGEIIRFLYYLPMERMKDFKAEVDRLVWEYIVELEEENKKLKEEKEILKKLNLWERTAYLERIEELEEENKKLREELKHREDFRKNFSDGTW